MPNELILGMKHLKKVLNIGCIDFLNRQLRWWPCSDWSI